MKTKMLKALFSLALTLALILTLGSVTFTLAAEPDQPSGTPYAGYLVILRPADPSAFSLFSAERPESLTLLYEDANIYRAPSMDSIRSLVYSGQVVLAEPDYQVELFDVVTDPNDPFFTTSTYQYNLRGPNQFGVNAIAAWDAGLSGSGVTVAVIDSGLNLDHQDCPANVGPGRFYYYRAYDPVKDKDLDIDKYFPSTFTDAYGNPYRDEEGNLKRYGFFSNDDPTDTIGHGTFISGIIAAPSNNGKNIAGMAPNVQIIPVRCFTRDPENNYLGGYLSNMVGGLNYAASLGVDVINMSWGITERSQALQTAITAAANAGCILVASAGNDGNDSYRYPAAYSNVISVGATTRSGSMASFSQRNDAVTVSAPGDYLYSLTIGSNTGTSPNSGTSFSAPQVAAAAALLREVHPNLTNSDFASLLSTTSNLSVLTGYTTSDGVNFAGAGLLDIKALLDAVGSRTANITPSAGAVSIQACFHPVTPPDTQPPPVVILLAAYNSAGHLVDSVGSLVTPSEYGGYQLSHRFQRTDVATLQAFFLSSDATLAAAAAPVIRIVGQ